MSDNKEHSRFQHLLSYLKGELTNRERHDLEQEMERDPFTSEAMEGLERIGPDKAAEDLFELHGKLRKRLRRRRRIALFGVAATVVSILIIGTVFLQIYDFKPDDRKQPPPAEVDEMTREQKGPAEPAEEPPPEDLQEAAQQPEMPAPVMQKEAVPEPKQDVVADQPVPEEEVLHVEARAAEEAAPARVSAYKEADVDMVMPEAEEEFRAPSPDPGETARSKKGAEAVARPISNREMPASPKAQEAEFRPDEELQMAGVAHWEDVRTGDPGSAEPLFGMEAFHKYVNASLKSPEELEPGKTAVVVLRFTVTPAGEITDIETVSSPGDSYTSAAEKVLLDGPQWIPARKDSVYVEDRVRYRFEFTGREGPGHP